MLLVVPRFRDEAPAYVGVMPTNRVPHRRLPCNLVPKLEGRLALLPLDCHLKPVPDIPSASAFATRAVDSS